MSVRELRASLRKDEATLKRRQQLAGKTSSVAASNEQIPVDALPSSGSR